MVDGGIPSKVYYQVSNGYEIVGSCSASESRIQGLVNINNMLNVPELNYLNMLVFKHDGMSTFRVRGFDDSLLEKSIAPT